MRARDEHATSNECDVAFEQYRIYSTAEFKLDYTHVRNHTTRHVYHIADLRACLLTTRLMMFCNITAHEEYSCTH